MISTFDKVFLPFLSAVYRARISMISVGMTYIASIIIGIVMVQTGNHFAVSYRDKIVSNAQSSPILVALDQNNRIEAAMLDFGGNLISGLGNTIGGLGVIIPYPFMAYRGWMGGLSRSMVRVSADLRTSEKQFITL